MPSYLVTGSSRGLGLHFVEELLKNPENFVIASVRNPSSALELQDLLNKYPKERSAIVKLDIDSPESIKSAAAEVSNLLPEGLDVFVSNAGVNFQPTATFEELDLPLFEEEMKLEIINNSILIRSFLPLIRAGKAKKFVFITSALGSIELAAGMPGLNDAYCVSRAALNMLIRKWGGALKYEGITTALVHPGWVPATEIGAGIEGWINKNAPNFPRVKPHDSAVGCVKLFETLTLEQTNSFWNYDGTKLPW
ncbi:putative short-chain dehydrogenases/reductase [Hyaloscypha variabilis F]|uniref:Putative short-chain dehydrogenases/reductase n=1 Tax=Hyaloscypha variabilis (strain UAMH 11265 / GT02V1 / F) TaxID=1149755 RepID=A0A2J6R3K8_HYAVF|nr:putative short-chain dehydrogenases/reductase [Hyaloscypha variabilis F]